MNAGAVPLMLLAAIGCADAAGSARHVVPNGDADRGEALIEAYGCGACHVIPGVTGARGTVGPPLTDFARRGYIAGALVNEPPNLIRWVMDPRAVEPGTVMPDLGVSAEEAAHIAAYLYTLGAGGGLGPPSLIPVEALEAIRGGGP